MPRLLTLVPAALLAASLGAAALAQTAAPAGPAPAPASVPSTAVDPTAAERDQRRIELEALTRDIVLSEGHRAALRQEIEALDQDSARLNDLLIETGKRAQGLEASIDRAEWRLQSMIASEISLRQDLSARREVFAEVLGALQRMGRKPPPAIVVRAEDALASVRSAMLLAAVVPGLEGEAAAVAADLKNLIALREGIAAEQRDLRGDVGQLAIEQARINLIIGEKKKTADTTREALAATEARAAALAEQATSLKDLIARMEAEIEAAAEAAKQAEIASLAPSARARPQSLGTNDRIAPAIPFAEAKKMLPFPANGVVVKKFGEDDGIGGTAQGISIATRSGARVSTPADGWVVYAGPFRSYGQLLIINASGGYHIVLAGMERIDVELGQFVLAGEPVALMGENRLASAGAVDIGASQPMLYVEFRKDGASVDPAPWWSRSSDEKVGG